MKIMICFALVLVLLMPMGLANAQSPSSSNACFEGGLMAGKCTTEWDFICGYYLALWLNGGGWSAANSIIFPDWCDPATLLPARPVETPVDSSSSTTPPIVLAGTITCDRNWVRWSTTFDPILVYLQPVGGIHYLVPSPSDSIGHSGLTYNLVYGGPGGIILDSVTCP